MQLFAIIAKTDGVTTDGRAVVEQFLKQQLTRERVQEYLQVFDQFLAETPEKRKPREGAERRVSVKDSVRVLRICTQINGELEQKQKVVVLFRIMEFISGGNSISPEVLEFASTVAETFNIEKEEANQIREFVLHSPEITPFNSNLLLLKDGENPGIAHFIKCEGLPGKMEFLKVNSVDMYVVRNLSPGELYINGQPLMEGKVVVLTQGSSIRGPKIKPVYYSDIVSHFFKRKESREIRYVAENIEFVFPNGYKGLQNLNFLETSGKMVGIMGASGAGKSTLLNILNGIETPTNGKITINGVDLHRESGKLEGVIGFVSQDDLLMEELSVFQNLFYNAKLCFGGMEVTELTSRVNKLLEDIGLFEIRHLKVGNPLNKKISGGQRKRLNIGLELIREPSVLFVDEPTSGLSSRDSENIMDLLKELSLKGKLVFVVIHQPSSDIFKMFDDLLILDTGGYPIYLGNPVDAIVYFKRAIQHVNCEESECQICGNVNPEQIFNIIESKVVDEYGNQTRERKIPPAEWNTLYEETIGNKPPQINQNQTTLLPDSGTRLPGWLSQLKVFITRDVLSKLTNSQYMLINFLEAPFLAFILAFLVRYHATGEGTTGYIFRENANIPAYVFMSIVVALFMGLTVSAEEIIRDQRILKRERFLNLSKSAYLISKVLILIVISGIQTLTYVWVGNGILEIQGMTAAYWVALFSASCFANMLGLNISATFNSAVTIYILIPILLIPQLLLSGVIVKFDKLNPVLASEEVVPVPGEMMASRWAFEAIAVHQFTQNSFEEQFYDIEKSIFHFDFQKTYWLPNLREKAGFCAEFLAGKGNKEKFEYSLKLLNNELRGQKNRFKGMDNSFIQFLNPKDFTPEVSKELNSYLEMLGDALIKAYNRDKEKKDLIIQSLQSGPEETQAYNQLKESNENEALNDLVKNDKDLIRIIEKEGKLIQKIHPVYKDPETAHPLQFRTHFFAPRKALMGLLFPTFQFNMAVIWGMTFSLFITLYFDVFRKSLDGMERFFSKFRKPGK